MLRRAILLLGYIHKEEREGLDLRETENHQFPIFFLL